MTNPLDIINSLVQNATSQSQIRWLMCKECGNVKEHDMSTLPAADPCPACSAPFNRITLGSRELAEQKRRELREAKGLPLSPADLAKITPPATPAPEPQAATTPPTSAPEPVVAEPKTRKRVPKATAPVAPTAPTAPEPAKEIPETAASLGSAPVQLVQLPDPDAEVDWEAKRAEDRALFISKLQLSPTTWTPVGSGRLFTTGFWTTNDDGSRRVDWFELHDTPQSFAARYAEARSRDPKTSADQGLINDLSADIKLVAFRGTVTASLRQALQHCSIRPAYGCRVSLAAKLTENGNISFQVVAVLK